MHTPIYYDITGQDNDTMNTAFNILIVCLLTCPVSAIHNLNTFTTSHILHILTFPGPARIDGLLNLYSSQTKWLRITSFLAPIKTSQRAIFKGCPAAMCEPL